MRASPRSTATQAEVAEQQSHDPHSALPPLPRSDGGIASADLDAIDAEVKAEIEAALVFARSSEEPDPATAMDYIYA